MNHLLRRWENSPSLPFHSIHPSLSHIPALDVDGPVFSRQFEFVTGDEPEGANRAAAESWHRAARRRRWLPRGGLEGSSRAQVEWIGRQDWLSVAWRRRRGGGLHWKAE